MIISTEAIVLQSKKFGDSSKIVTLFTKSNGRLSVIAKGARNTKNKFGSSLEPMSHIFLSFYKKPQGDLHLLSKSELISHPKHIHESLELLSAGLLIIESVVQIAQENEENEELFSFLAKTLCLLNDCKENSFSLFVGFELKLARILGFGIDFTAPVELLGVSQNEKQEILFSIENGNVARKAQSNRNSLYSFKRNILMSLTELSQLPIEQAGTIELNSGAKSQIHNFLVNYFSFHLEKLFSYRSFNLLKV